MLVCHLGRRRRVFQTSSKIITFTISKFKQAAPALLGPPSSAASWGLGPQSMGAREDSSRPGQTKQPSSDVPAGLCGILWYVRSSRAEDDRRWAFRSFWSAGRSCFAAAMPKAMAISSVSPHVGASVRSSRSLPCAFSCCTQHIFE